jgi:dethiobiotin synthetase
LKPVAAGCALLDGQWMNADARQLMLASSVHPDYPTVNPAALHAAMAPHIAAEREGKQLDCEQLASHCTSLLDRADFSVIEGAGGWRVPLNESADMADLAIRLGCPIILVVGMRLGCINHALLTAQAVTDAGLILAGWVANHIDPAMAVADANVATLERRLQAPLLGRIPCLDYSDARLARAYLQLDVLLQ